jgi:hypothetical protein
MKYHDTALVFVPAVIKPADVRDFHSSNPEDKIMNTLLDILTILPHGKYACNMIFELLSTPFDLNMAFIVTWFKRRV